jgi:hypothetical protein
MTPTKVAVLVRQFELEVIAQHRREMAWHKTQLDPVEKDVLHLLIAGADIEPGRFRAKISYLRRHNMAWRKLVEDRLGADFAEREFRASPMIAVPRLELVEHAPELPLFLHLDDK